MHAFIEVSLRRADPLFLAANYRFRSGHIVDSGSAEALDQTCALLFSSWQMPALLLHCEPESIASALREPPEAHIQLPPANAVRSTSATTKPLRSTPGNRRT